MVVKGEVGSGQFQLQQVLLARQVQGAGFFRRMLALVQEVGDVFAREGLIGEGILQGPGDDLHAVAFAQGDDLLDMVFGVKAALFQLLVVSGALGQRAKKRRKSFCSRALLRCRSKGATWSGNS